MWDDRHLIRQLRRGNPDALRQIYQRHKDDLLTIATCLLADVAAAEDVLHDVFVALASGAGELCIRNTLEGYLKTCVANRARDYMRQNVRRNRLHPVALEDAAEIESTIVEPPTQLVDRETTQAVYEALAELPYEQREVITLHLHGPMTFKEIARQQSVSINTAQSRYCYGIDKLRSLLHAGVKT